MKTSENCGTALVQVDRLKNQFKSDLKKKPRDPL